MSASSKELAQMGAVPPAPAKGAGSVLDFGQPDSDTENNQADSLDAAPLDLEQLLTTVRETAYRWDLSTDRIDWAANAEAVLCVAGADKIGRGRAFALLVDPEQAGARYDGITGGPHVTPETELRYCLRSAARRCGSKTPASVRSMRRDVRA